MRVSLFPVVVQQRYIENQDSEYYFQRLSSLAASLSFEFYQFGIETGNWSTQAGTTLINFKNDYQEINTIHLFKMGSTFQWLYFYSGIGIGSYDSELDSQFNGVSTKTKSGQTLFGSGIFSIQAILGYFHMSTELKLLFAKDYRPQPTPDLAFKLGVSF